MGKLLLLTLDEPEEKVEVNLTRLEYSTLVFLASNPGIVLTRTQIFEAFGTWIAIAAIQALRAGFTTCGKR